MRELEPERYELQSGPAYEFEPARREFFRLVGGGIVIVSLMTREAQAQESGGGGRGAGGRQRPREIDAWLHIAADGGVTVYSGKVEVGQNARTLLAQVVAEELRVPVARIRTILGDTDLTPFDAGTFGSQTTPSMAPQLRRAAAAAREALVDLAASSWGVDRGSLAVDAGRVLHAASGRSASYGELSKGQKLMRAIAEGATLTPATEWKVAGTSIPKVDGRTFVTGGHRYASDVKLPGILRGKMLRPPAAGATLAAFDATAAEAIPGVTVVRDGEFAGVAASDERTGERALAAIRAEWKLTPQPSQAELFDYLKKTPPGAQGVQGRSGHTAGSVEEGLAAADKRLRRTYTVAYIAHAPLEPRAAVAQWTDGRLTVWTGTQRPFGVRGELAQAFRIPESEVRVIVPDTGSGYGGKHTGEAAVEAARLARAAGRPVKIVWTREEEFQCAYLRPAGVIEVSSGVRSDGVVTAWEFHNYNSGASSIRTLYDIPNQKIEFHSARSPFRQGSYRGLAATANHFARETHMDELAELVGMDPLEFRLRNLKDARLRAVLEAAATAFRWQARKAGPGRGYGIAGGFEKGSYVATCAEVAVEQPARGIRITRLVTAFECGAVVNPDHLKNQVEGAVVMGIGGALFEQILFDSGRIVNARFSRYRVPRFSDVPPMETVLVDRKDLPSAGAGETPIVAVAPAVGGAIFQAAGVRPRSLPMVPNGLPA